MSSPRERLLAEGIKNKILAIQKSHQVYEKLSRAERRMLRLSAQDVQRAAAMVAANVERYVVAFEKRNRTTPNAQLIKNRIRRELDNI